MDGLTWEAAPVPAPFGLPLGQPQTGDRLQKEGLAQAGGIQPPGGATWELAGLPEGQDQKELRESNRGWSRIPREGGRRERHRRDRKGSAGR